MGSVGSLKRFLTFGGLELLCVDVVVVVVGVVIFVGVVDLLVVVDVVVVLSVRFFVWGFLTRFARGL